ncbi:MAG TPA: tRNA glutamyl-Q(34) synthetase GluQRS, partial [Thermoanaerobaculia bacterium]
SPTGPLHLGSLVAAAGSWLFARHAGARWLVRIEDIDTPRVIPGSAEEILAALARYGLEWDGEVVWQSKRLPLYAAALEQLRRSGRAFDCGCSRTEKCRCREGLGEGRTARAIRFRSTDALMPFHDAVQGPIEERADDFVIRRADGLFAYQLVVVVDDAEQGVTQVVRGADLLSSTPRQIALQQALGYPTPSYAHLPLVVNADGAKLGKRDGALPLPTLDDGRVRESLATALAFLGIEVEPAAPRAMLDEALRRFTPGVIREKGSRRMSYDVVNNTAESRYETTVDGEVSVAEYHREGNRITFTHTIVPEKLEGRGIAGAIVKKALDDAKAEGLEVVAQCAYVKAYIKRHPEYEDLVRP